MLVQNAFEKKCGEGSKDAVMSKLKPEAREVHVLIHSQDICAFCDHNKTCMVCFRCGEVGHARFQCLTYKVRLCWHHQNGGCKDRNCQFAHGESELRTPWRARCVRVVRQSGRYVCIGCNSLDHTFKRCPHSQDLIWWS